MKLRRLELRDAKHMYEWMQDKDVVEHLSKDFRKLTEEDCRKFIRDSLTDKLNRHYAIADDDDVYLGTVSLKNIDKRSAEFAIILRRGAMGRGIAADAMKQVLQKGFSKLGLKYIYWYVSPDNKRAVKFYEKNSCQRILPEQLNILKIYDKDQFEKYYWYWKERKG